MDHASDVIGDRKTDPEELRALATDLSGTLQDTLRVAESRGRRLPGPSPPETRAGSPVLPADAFG
ncbi:hypothetical protein GCM10020367_52240 [Streptomyces sannanensis]|uniref:Uncharacterized protein n=1 Tax=Streptomyces sannanensis TaxID=285536 RepID=A0ABP6SIU5_9ACTN